MNNTLVAILGSLVVATACVAEPEVTPVSPQKVDLSAIISMGVVEPVDGVSAAGQPDEASLKVFADSGYAAVIDLRTAGESRGLDEPVVVESLGMAYVSLPIGRGDISFENAKTLGKLIDSYDGPVLVHCGSSNRVGALLALRASLDGLGDEAAIEMGKKGGLTSLEPTVRDVLGEK